MRTHGSSSMRTKKLIEALIVITTLSIFFLIYYVVSDDGIEPEDLSKEENFKQLINTENSLVVFYTKG